MGRLTIRLLGSFQVSIEATPIPNFESNKVRSLLAYLAVESSQAHSREKLAALFWPDMPAKRANANLSHALYNLRTTIQDHQADPPYLLRSREAVQFNPDSNYWLDVDAFIEQLSGNRIQDRTHLEKLQEAVDLYRGNFLEGLVFDSSLVFDEWVLVLRQRLQRRVLGGLHLLAETYAERGDVASALPYAWRQVEQDPLGEPAYRQLIHLLATSDQRSQALAQFNRLQILLAEELNIAPEPETVALRDQIRGEEHLATRDKPRGNNLPAFLTPLIGRQQELAELQDQCRNPDCRLLTVLGPGGSGKTRLALEVARSSRENFRHGVFFVPLNPVQSPASITPAIVDALDLPRGDQDDHQAQLTNYLRDKELLVVLDGFERLLEGAGLMAEILHQAPGIKILTTSRARLNIKAEQLYLLAGMRYPEKDVSASEIQESDAVRLLIAGLRRTRPDYDPAPEELIHLLQVCRQVLGMPLGILLAASWGAILGIEEIAGMVSRSLDFLTADWTDVPARQRSLRATFDYTWNLLEERQRSIFQSLSVFRGAFTRRAAQAVSDASPHELRGLMDRSLLWSKTPGWYEVHELLRQYAADRLGQFPEFESKIRTRHMIFYTDALHQWGEDLKGPRQFEALVEIAFNIDNARLAWEYSVEKSDWARVDRAMDGLFLFYDRRGRYQEAKLVCHLVTGKLIGSPQSMGRRVRAKTLTWQAHFHFLLGDIDQALEFVDQSIYILSDIQSNGNEIRSMKAFALLIKGTVLFNSDRNLVRELIKECVMLYQSVNDDWGLANALTSLGVLDGNMGEVDLGLQSIQKGLNIQKRLGDRVGEMKTLAEYHNAMFIIGCLDEAISLAEQYIDVSREIDDLNGVAQGLVRLGGDQFRLGLYGDAIQNFEKSLLILNGLGARSDFIFYSSMMCMVEMLQGSYVRAKQRIDATMDEALEISDDRSIGILSVANSLFLMKEERWEDARDSVWVSLKINEQLKQMTTTGIAISTIGLIEIKRGDWCSAKPWLEKFLSHINNMRAYFLVEISWVLPEIALYMLGQGDVERAIEVYSPTKEDPLVANSAWFADIAGREIAAAAETLPPEVVAAAQERGKKQDIWETASELLEELSEKVI